MGLGRGGGGGFIVLELRTKQIHIKSNTERKHLFTIMMMMMIILIISFMKEGNVLFKEGRKEMFYLKMHSTHCIYGYMALDIW